MVEKAEPFLVIGAGGHGKVVADLLRALGHEVEGFLDVDPDRIGMVAEPMGARIVGVQDQHFARLLKGRSEGYAYALGIGDNRARTTVSLALDESRLPALVHPAATVSPSANIGPGAVVFAGAVIQPAAHVGKGTIVNTGAIVEHDCQIGEMAHLSPGAVLGGGVEVGDRSWVGAGATVIHGIRIGADAVVGAGAVIIKHVPAGATVVGNPGRILRRSP